MTASGHKSLSALGFLTVVEHPQQGLFGGYLVLNTTGRPLEFHCTAPVKANRAQEILYGPTLVPYLYGEQIGKTLLNKAKVKPLLVCTDLAPVLAVRSLVTEPVLLVQPPEASSQAENVTRRLDASHQDRGAPHATDLHHFSLGENRVAVSTEYVNDQQQTLSHWQAHFAGFDLPEPFSRIREAIEEAQRTTR